MVTFAQGPTFQSDEEFELDVSDDGEAWTLTFPGFEVPVGGTNRGRLADWSPELLSPAPTATRAFFLVMPLEGDDNESVEIDFRVQGFVLTTEGATATVMLSVNGQTTFADFPANSEESYLQSLKFTASSPPSECRLSVFLLVGRDSTNSDAEAFINTLSIDANIPSAPAGCMLERPPSFVTKWGQMGERDGRFVTPQGVAVDSSGNVYVADMGMDRIQKFDSEGTFSTKWGSAGEENGEFHEPQGVAVDSSGYVYVSEQGSNRIQKFGKGVTRVAEFEIYKDQDNPQDFRWRLRAN